MGGGGYFIEGQSFSARPGDLLLFNSHTAHYEYTCGNACVSYCIGIKGLSLDGLPKDHIIGKELSPLQSLGAFYPRFLQLFEGLWQEAREDGAATQYLLAALLSKLLLFLKEHGAANHTELDALVARAKRFIDENYREPLRLAAIAKACHANPYYLSRLFKAELGLSPMQYCILHRIGEAQNLLINTGDTITKIAMTVGYNNSNYFQNVFKDALGMTPREYRQKWVGDQERD